MATPTLTTSSCTMSSLEIADLTGKNHADVMRDIRSTLKQAGIDAAQFCAAQKYNNNNTRTIYRLPRAECDLVISGYSVKYRWAIIQRWHELERKVGAQQPKPRKPIRLSKDYIDAFYGFVEATGGVVLSRDEYENLKARPTVNIDEVLKMLEARLNAGRFSVTLREDNSLHLSEMPVKSKAALSAPVARSKGPQWKDPAEAENLLKSMRFREDEMYDLNLIPPERVAQMHRAGMVGPRQWAKLKRLIAA